MRGLCVCVLVLSLADFARADERAVAPEVAAPEIAHADEAPQRWEDGWRVTAGATVALGSYAIGVGLWVATFFADVEICNAVAGDVCGLWGVGVGGALFLAAQAALTPALLGWLSNATGAAYDEGWTFAGAALATGAGLLVTGGTLALALFETEVRTETAFGIALTAGAVADVVVALLFHELTRPRVRTGATSRAAPSGSVTWLPAAGGIRAVW